jgi:hypothetical protein
MDPMARVTIRELCNQGGEVVDRAADPVALREDIDGLFREDLDEILGLR